MERTSSILLQLLGSCQHQPKNDAGSSSQTSNFGADVQKGPVVVNTIGKSVQSNITVRVISMSERRAKRQRLGQQQRGNPRGTHTTTSRAEILVARFHLPEKNVFLVWLRTFRAKHRIDVYPDVLHSSGWYAAREFYFQRPGCSCPLPEFRRQRGLHDSGLGNGLRQHQRMVLPNGSTVTNGIIPSQSLDPGAAALASIWPAANITDLSTIQQRGGNYFQSFPATTTVILYRVRVDYDLTIRTNFLSRTNTERFCPANGSGAHVWYIPGNSTN